MAIWLTRDAQNLGGGKQTTDMAQVMGSYG